MPADRTCAEKLLDKTANTELKKCDSCNRELGASSEWICSDDRVICDICYQSLLSPNKKISFEL